MVGVQDKQGRSRPSGWSIAGLVLAVSVAFFALVGNYGPGYDELIGDFQYGERSWFFLLNWDRRYLELNQTAPRELVVEGHRDLAPMKLEAPFVHGHGAAVGSAAACWLLFRTLGVLPAVDAHHTVNLVFGLALILLLFVQLHRLLGAAAAWLAVACWLGQPRLVAHAFFNTKDFPEACLFGLAVLTFWMGWGNREQGSRSSERDVAAGPPTPALPHKGGGSRRWGLLSISAALWGFALSVKVNAVFLPAVVGGWVLLLWLSRQAGFAQGDWKWVAIYPAVAAGSFFATWPYLWLYPSEVWKHLQFVVARGHVGTLAFDLAPLGEWLSATPEVVLGGLVLGIVFACREPLRARRKFLWLVILWLAVPLVRANVPGMRHYDGIRHFLEVTVPAAVLAGYGWGTAGRWAWNRHALLGAGIVALVAAGLAWPFWGLHPFELAYFNRVSGGLPAAVARGEPDAGDYWAASYRQGVRWLNGHAPRGATVVVPFAEHLVTLTRGSRDGLRPDFELVHVSGPFELAAGEVYEQPYERALQRGPVYVMFVRRKSWENAIMRHARRHGEAVYPDGMVDGVEVLSIFLVPAGSGPVGRP